MEIIGLSIMYAKDLAKVDPTSKHPLRPGPAVYAIRSISSNPLSESLKIFFNNGNILSA